jgi:DNA polymerase I-like protein with 3'-5' exonuclease and polymerase domains
MKRPNLRKMFIPDPGMIFCEADLEGADAQVVAWEANDHKLKDAFKAKVAIHLFNAKDLLGLDLTKKDPMYSKIKMVIHGTNYGAGPPKIAAILGCTVEEATRLQNRWFFLHPAIKAWHARVAQDILTTRTVVTKWGRKITWLGRNRRPTGEVDTQMFNAALAAVPQSTVADTINKGLLRVWRHMPEVQLLGQVHDSVLMQIPSVELIPEINRLMQVVIPYEDPLTIPMEFKVSEKSWGDVTKFNLEVA